jgi:membrane protease YdiL (CAAX protease family)
MRIVTPTTGPFSPLWFSAAAPLFVFLAAVAIAAAFAYPLFLLTAGQIPIQKFVSRGALLLLVASAILIMRGQRLSAEDIGFSSTRKSFLSQLARGFGCGLIMLGLQVLILLHLDLRVLDPIRLASASTLLSAAMKAFLTGALVALVEEPLFRGILLQNLLHRANRVFAVVITSAYYAGLHFLRSDARFDADTVNWHSGFAVALDAFDHLFDPRNLDSFLALFAVGIFLASLRIAVPKSLGYCIGLHAGWVFIIKLTKTVSKDNPHATWSFLTGSYDGIIGYLTAGWIGLLAIVMFYWHQEQGRKSAMRKVP